jgi:hypothetical protein
MVVVMVVVVVVVFEAEAEAVDIYTPHTRFSLGSDSKSFLPHHIPKTTARQTIASQPTPRQRLRGWFP